MVRQGLRRFLSGACCPLTRSCGSTEIDPVSRAGRGRYPSARLAEPPAVQCGLSDAAAIDKGLEGVLGRVVDHDRVPDLGQCEQVGLRQQGVNTRIAVGLLEL